MPRRVKAQARGEENDSTAESPRSKSWAHKRRWPSLRARPAPDPTAQSQRAWRPSLPEPAGKGRSRRGLAIRARALEGFEVTFGPRRPNHLAADLPSILACL